MANLSEAGWFATSNKPRRKRPAKVEFFVGEVVYISLFRAHCAIVGWDAELRAPAEWAEAVYGEEAHLARDEPHYTLLCDAREIEGPEEEFQYCAQNELEDPPEIVRELETKKMTQISASIPLLFCAENGIVASINRRRVLSLHLESFFEGFSEETGRYALRPWLRRLYPRDAEEVQS